VKNTLTFAAKDTQLGGTNVGGLSLFSGPYVVVSPAMSGGCTPKTNHAISPSGQCASAHSRLCVCLRPASSLSRDRAAFNDCVIRVGRFAKVFAWQRLRRETVRYPNSFRTCLLQYRIVRGLFGFQPPSNKHSAAVTEPNTGRSVVNLDRDARRFRKTRNARRANPG
jgi:hypothetical protein